MTSLFVAADNAHFVQRLENLPADARPEWGKMSAPQMLAHCQRAMEVALGERKLKRAIIGRLFGGFAKRKYVAGTQPFPRNSPTDPNFIVADPRAFADEKAALIQLVHRLSAPDVLTTEPHPFFGPMTPAEWDQLMVKHLDHHLRQFGG